MHFVKHLPSIIYTGVLIYGDGKLAAVKYMGPREIPTCLPHNRRQRNILGFSVLVAHNV